MPPNIPSWQWSSSHMPHDTLAGQWTTLGELNHYQQLPPAATRDAKHLMCVCVCVIKTEQPRNILYYENCMEHPSHNKTSNHPSHAQSPFLKIHTIFGSNFVRQLVLHNSKDMRFRIFDGFLQIRDPALQKGT